MPSLSRLVRMASVVGVFALVVPNGASAQDENDAASGPERVLAQGRKALDDQRFDEARALVTPLCTSPARAVRAEALEVRAIAALMGGRTDEGQRAARELYDLSPGLALGESPLPEPVVRVFRAEAERPRPSRVQVKIEPVAGSRAAFDLVPDRAVQTVRVACRRDGRKAFGPVPTAPRDGRWRFQLAAAPHACFALAVDGDGLLVGRLGSRTHPVPVAPVTSEAEPIERAAPDTAPPPREPSKSVFENWWFWAAAGAVVTAGTITVIVAATSGGSSAEKDNVGTRPSGIIVF